MEETMAVTSAISPADTTFILICAALVLFMIPGLALFYGGMVRSKNVLNTLLKCMICIGVVSIQWVIIGYSLSFGNSTGGLIGDLSMVMLRGVGFEANGTIPHMLFMMFQLMFACITPALIVGAFAERMKFSTFLVFVLVWSTLVYDPLCHWIWGGGWLGADGVGALDFAGGYVVHISSGAAALVCAIVIGKRAEYGKAVIAPHNLPMTVLGAGMLWFGWFGFNAGSALQANSVAVNAFTTTHLAGAAAALSWMVAEWISVGKPTTLGVVSGAIAGLATVTGGAGFVSPGAAILIGLAAGLVCCFAVMQKNRLGYDDALDVVGVHGVGGALGVLCTGVFASLGAKGLLMGSPALLGKQALAVAVTVVYSMAVTFVILKVLDAFMGLRVTLHEETEGLDISQHDEIGYIN